MMAVHRTDQSLKSALLGTEILLFYNTPLHYHSQVPPLLPMKYESKYYYKFFLDHFVPSINRPRNLSAAAQMIWRVVAETWSCDPTLVEKVRRKIPSILQNNQFKEILEKHLCLQDCIQAVLFSSHEVMERFIGSLKVHFVRSLVVCTVSGQCCLMTYNHFLAVVDTYRTRLHLYLAALVEDLMCKWPVSCLEMVHNLINHLDQAAKALDHDTYFGAVKSMYSRAQGKVRKYHNVSLPDHTDDVKRVC